MQKSTRRSKSTYSTVSAQVLNYIRDGILSGRYPIGTKLDQQAIADELGISVIPIREGLRQLEAEGLVENFPYRGAFVSELSGEQLQDIYQIREVLEELATALAVPRLISAQVAQLEDTLSEMSRATEAEDFELLLNLNRTFHFTIYEACGNSLLIQTISSLWDRASSYRRVFTHFPDRATQALEEHRRIFLACKNGNAGAAGIAMRDNVHQTTEALRSRLSIQSASVEP